MRMSSRLNRLFRVLAVIAASSVAIGWLDPRVSGIESASPQPALAATQVNGGGSKPNQDGQAAGDAASSGRIPPTTLATMAPFDRVYLKGKREPLMVQPTLPRPFNPLTIRRGETISLKQYRADRPDTGASIGIKGDEIARVELFEELLV